MSVAKTITDAVATAVGAIASVPTVTVREQRYKLDGDTLPLVVITEGPEQTLRYITHGCVLRGYVVVVTVLYARNQLLTGDGRDSAKGWRETIRKALVPDDSVAPGSVLAGVAAVWDVDAEDVPTEPEADFRAGYQTAELGLLYKTSEASHA